MASESSIPKPADLFIGVVDLFAVLVPGMIAAFLIVEARAETPERGFFFGCELVVVGWVLGHVLNGIGALLDEPYDWFFEPPETKPAADKSTKHALFYLAREIEFPSKRHGQCFPPVRMFQWALAWLRSRHPQATAEVDRIAADSKLFRSLTVLLLAAMLVIILKHGPVVGNCALPANTPGDWYLAAGAGTGALFSLWRYCGLRRKMVRQCFLHYVQLHGWPGQVPRD